MKHLFLMTLTTAITACGVNVKIPNSEHRIVHTVDFGSLSELIESTCRPAKDPVKCQQDILSAIFDMVSEKKGE